MLQQRHSYKYAKTHALTVLWISYEPSTTFSLIAKSLVFVLTHNPRCGSLCVFVYPITPPVAVSMSRGGGGQDQVSWEGATSQYTLSNVVLCLNKLNKHYFSNPFLSQQYAWPSHCWLNTSMYFFSMKFLQKYMIHGQIFAVGVQAWIPGLRIKV